MLTSEIQVNSIALNHAHVLLFFVIDYSAKFTDLTNVPITCIASRRKCILLLLQHS